MRASIVSCFIGLGSAFFLLGFVMYIFALVLLQDASVYLWNEPSPPQKVVKCLEDDFSSIGRAIFSLVQAVSGGRSWGEYAEPWLVINPWSGVAFTLFITFVVFGLLNIITGVFVQSTSAVANIDQELILQEEVRKAKGVMNQ